MAELTEIVQRREAGALSLSDIRFNPARPQDARAQIEACLTDHQRVFIEAYLTRGSGCYLNAAGAARVAWPEAQYPHQQAGQARKNPAVALLIQWHLAQHGLGRSRALNQLASWIFETSLADFEPYIRGEMTLAELRDDGVDVTAVASVREVRDNKGGISRSVDLIPKVPMMAQLLRAIGAFDNRQQDIPTTISKHNSNQTVIIREMSVLNELRDGVTTPTAPGVPARQIPAGKPTPEYIANIRAYARQLEQQAAGVAEQGPDDDEPAEVDSEPPMLIGRTADQYPASDEQTDQTV